MSNLQILPALPGPTAGLSIGLFGGSFNPAHEGHLHVAETALKQLQLDWIWWIVARGNPLKSDHGDYAARFASADALVRDHPRMIVTDIEARLGENYTSQTLAALIARSPRARFVWVMGGDSLAGFHHWRDWEGIAEQVPIACVARPGYGAKARRARFARHFTEAQISESRAHALPFLDPPAWTYLTARLHPASSTAIRSGG